MNMSKIDSITVHIYHNTHVSIADLEQIFVPLFGNVYSYPILVNMSDHIWCAYIDTNLIGCVLARKQQQQSILYLILFGIKQTYQSLGIGSSLLTTILNYIQRHHYTDIVLHTECNNDRAINFYEKFGFIKEFRINNYYRTMATFYPDAFQMRISLK